YANQYSPYFVFVNKKRMGKLDYGETKEFVFTPEKHGNNTFVIKNASELDVEGSFDSGNVDFKLGIGGRIGVECGASMIDSSWTLKWTTANLGYMEGETSGKAKVDVTVNEDVIDKEVFTEPVDIVEGVVAEYTLERRYEHTITKTHMTGNEYGGSATASIGPKLFFASAELTAEVKAKTESSLGVTIGKSETYTQKITVDGDKTPKLKVTWVNRYRKCTATLPDGRRETYLVCVGVRWKLKKVENGK
ncbi:MAG: hypothetical protein ACLQVF_12780, partial [Isosphaeraceae bacterium]